MVDPIGCIIKPLTMEECLSIVGWLLNKSPQPDSAKRVAEKETWALVHCDSGVTWGRLDFGEWLLGSAAFPALCPVPHEEVIQELRIFSEDGELLLWRTDDGLTGRLLEDSDDAALDESVEPDEDTRLVMASQVIETRDGFSLVTDGRGRQQAVPFVMKLGRTRRTLQHWPRLRIRNYFEEDPATGVVRVCATRLVGVIPGETE